MYLEVLVQTKMMSEKTDSNNLLFDALEGENNIRKVLSPPKTTSPVGDVQRFQNCSRST